MTWIIKDRNVFGFGRFVNVLQIFLLMTATSFTELDVFFLPSFNILNKDLSGNVDKISSIIFKYTIHNWIRSYFSSRRTLYTKWWLKWRHSHQHSCKNRLHRTLTKRPNVLRKFFKLRLEFIIYQIPLLLFLFKCLNYRLLLLVCFDVFRSKARHSHAVQNCHIMNL